MDAKRKFLIKIKRYKRQLSTGCTQENCTNPFCASNPVFPRDRVLESDATGLAFKYALLKENRLCPPQYLPITDKLSFYDLVELFDYAAEDGGLIALVKSIEMVFSDIHKLSMSFSDQFPDSDDAIPEDHHLDPEQGPNSDSLIRMYHLFSQHADVLAAAQRALSTLCQNLGAVPRLDPRVPFERVAPIVLLAPFMSDPDNLPNVAAVCRMIAQMEGSRQNRLVRWMSGYGANAMQGVVSVLQQYITLRFLMGPIGGEDIDRFNWVSQTLELAYKANEAPPVAIPYTEFYNDTVNDSINLDLDFQRKMDDRFAFCRFPFFLKPGAKAQLLRNEAKMKQESLARRAMFESLIFRRRQPIHCIFRIRRSFLIPDTLTQLAQASSEGVLSLPLKVIFEGEAGVDEGGVRKEFFMLVCRSLFDPDYGMFTYDEEARAYWFNFNSLESGNEFKLVGAVLGLAIYNGVILDVHFPQAVYKKLLGLPVGLADLEAITPTVARSLRQLLEMEDVAPLEQPFCIEQMVFGTPQTIELKPGGAGILVTNENRIEYVDTYADWYLTSSVMKQFEAFKSGFRMVTADLIKTFRPEELELVICGSPSLNFEALQKNTRYDNGYDANHPYIREFWNIIHAMSLDERKQFLAFVTGSDRSPVGGLGDLPFVIARNGGDTDRLPTSHTCFNVFLLPEYSSTDKLRRMLLTAIQNSQGFGLM